jgi:hypothetical protein
MPWRSTSSRKTSRPRPTTRKTSRPRPTTLHRTGRSSTCPPWQSTRAPASTRAQPPQATAAIGTNAVALGDGAVLATSVSPLGTCTSASSAAATDNAAARSEGAATTISARCARGTPHRFAVPAVATTSSVAPTDGAGTTASACTDQAAPTPPASERSQRALPHAPPHTHTPCAPCVRRADDNALSGVLAEILRAMRTTRRPFAWSRSTTARRVWVSR